MYWFHKSEGYSLLTKTPSDEELHGVFAARSPNRPNPIGFSIIEFVERRGDSLKVKGLDTVNGTPLIDLKPYIPKINSKKNLKIGWLTNKLPK